jgi:peptidoglycan/LPS O-acetylase OafA/YrhL
MKRIASLDGIRALSISLVLLAHLATSGSAPLIAKVVWRFDLGNLGVRVFFVISGFLITSILLREKIDLKDFYVRRFWRIFPAYYVFLAAMAFLIPVSDLLHAASYTTNYYLPHWPVGHTWSLSVEEQFYLLWPGLLAFWSRAFWGAGAVLIAAPIFRVLALHGMWPTYPVFAFECVADALATGCLLAHLRGRISLGLPWSLGAIAILVLWRGIQPDASVYALMGIPLLNIAIALAVGEFIKRPGGILNWKPLVWMGTLSYSLYLWQQPFMDQAIHLPAIVRVAGAFAMACVSYYLIERPCLRIRTRFTSEVTVQRLGTDSTDSPPQSA